MSPSFDKYQVNTHAARWLGFNHSCFVLFQGPRHGIYWLKMGMENCWHHTLQVAVWNHSLWNPNLIIPLQIDQSNLVKRWGISRVDEFGTRCQIKFALINLIEPLMRSFSQTYVIYRDLIRQGFAKQLCCVDSMLLDILIQKHNIVNINWTVESQAT